MILSEKLKYMLIPSFWKWCKSRSKSPSTKVQFAFRLRYPNARQIQWKQIDVFKWQVSFKSKRIMYWSLFTSEGNWLETMRAVSLQDIPKKIQENYESKYGPKGLQHIYKIQTSLRTIFEIQWGNGIYNLKLMYDENGKMVGKLWAK